jgi:TPR repeat protein
MVLRHFVGPILLVAALICAWTWPPSARVLHGGLENNIGYLYLHGMGVTQDSQKAIDWYTRAAERGLPTAEYNLAFIYQTGNGVVPNPREAERWYERAASQGHAEAANNLAMMHTDGSLGKRDLPLARAWLKRARALASAESAAQLGENLAALEHDMTPDQVARSEVLFAALPQGH